MPIWRLVRLVRTFLVSCWARAPRYRYTYCLGNRSGRRHKRPTKRSNNENGHGRPTESLDLQAPSTQDARKNLPPSSSRSGGAWYATSRVRITGWGRHGNQTRASARLPVYPRAWKAGMHGGLAPLVLGCGGILVSLLGDGWMDGHSVSASRLMGGPLYARPVSAASHHFPSSQLLSRSAQSQVNVQSDHDSNAPPCYVYTQADGQAGRQAGEQARPNHGRPVYVHNTAHPRCGHCGPIHSQCLRKTLAYSLPLGRSGVNASQSGVRFNSPPSVRVPTGS